MPDILVATLAVLAAAGIAFVLTTIIGAVGRLAARRRPLAGEIVRRGRLPVSILLATLGVWATLAVTAEDSSWWPGTRHTLAIVLIVAIAWLLVQAASVVEQVIDERYPTDVEDNRHARRVHTQVEILRRVVAAIIVLVAAAAVLFTFPGMRAVGASLLASAGLVSIIAGLAAQTSLANMFAGMQIAFTDALRVDDVVVVEGEWGRIEEITLTYVVVHIWDDRRLVLPSSYFTTTPFQNWTRTASQLLGSVELDVDWRVPIDQMRAEMDRLLGATDLWDGRVGIIQVTDATGGTVKLRALTSAASGPILWDLRCYLREGLVTWLQAQSAGLPRTRFEAVSDRAELPTRTGAEAPRTATDQAPERPGPALSADDTGGLFTGTDAATLRSQQFTGVPHHDVAESETTASRKLRERGEGGGTHGEG